MRIFKPQFELRLAALPDDTASLGHAVTLAARGIEAAGWDVIDSMRSPALGARGAVEFLITHTKGHPMITDEHVEHFRTFGFVILRRPNSTPIRSGRALS